MLLEGSFQLFATILLAQVLWGIGYTFISGAKDAWLADELGEERLTAVYLRGSQVAQIAITGRNRGQRPPGKPPAQLTLLRRAAYPYSSRLLFWSYLCPNMVFHLRSDRRAQYLAKNGRHIPRRNAGNSHSAPAGHDSGYFILLRPVQRSTRPSLAAAVPGKYRSASYW